MAITVTVADVKKRFPEFSAIDEETITPWLAEATNCVNESQWGTVRGTSAVLQLAAHLLTLFADPDCVEPPPGPVSTEREGGISAGYKVADRFAEDDLGSTKYGRHYITLRRKIFVTRKV